MECDCLWVKLYCLFEDIQKSKNEILAKVNAQRLKNIADEMLKLEKFTYENDIVKSYNKPTKTINDFLNVNNAIVSINDNTINTLSFDKTVIDSKTVYALKINDKFSKAVINQINNSSIIPFSLNGSIVFGRTCVERATQYELTHGETCLFVGLVHRVNVVVSSGAEKGILR